MTCAGRRRAFALRFPVGGMARPRRARSVDLRYGSVERLPFADETFDKVFAINSMQVSQDVGTGLREIWRVLKPSGSVALCFTVNSGQSKDRVVGSLTTAGFAQERMVDQANLFCTIAAKP